MSLSFDSVADQYRAARPGYPAELFDFVIEASGIGVNSILLEVGCGTGQATAGFASRGYEILCLEPGSELAQRARQELSRYHLVRIEQETFESWAPGDRRFSLLFSAQAYHWIAPPVAVSKPRSVLQENGTVALFWNLPIDEPTPLRAALDLAYAQHAPALAAASRSAASLRVRSEAVAAQLASSSLYSSLAKQSFPWARIYSADNYIRLLGTFSDHLALGPEARANLFRAVAEEILGAGGSIEVKYETVCHMFRCR